MTSTSDFHRCSRCLGESNDAMGAGLSAAERDPSPDPWWGQNTDAAQPSRFVNSSLADDSYDSEISPVAELEENKSLIDQQECGDRSLINIRSTENRKKLEIFKEELAVKRDARRKAIAASADKLRVLEQRLAEEEQARIEAQNKVARLEELLAESHAKERRTNDSWQQDTQQEMERRFQVASIEKEMLRIRELQVKELKQKLCEVRCQEDLREEYEAQIENVKRLKHLYEEKAETTKSEHQREIEKEISRIKLLESKVAELEREREDAESMRERLKSRVLKLDKELEERNDAALALQEQLDASVVECRELAAQMSSINDVFTRMLAGCADIDRSTEETSDTEGTEAIETEDDGSGSVLENLPKIWEILVRLSTRDDASSASSESCYKSVDTPSGKRSVISVSQTFLTLKNLILEKNALVKEVNKLKVLNGHLETRLGNQEKRLSTVSTELKKTWGVVSKLRAQHRQLHTQEKILKYELQHKRSLLNDLKDELERCKEIWDEARQKNCQSEEEWRKLRKEFAERRKDRPFCNSVESGYEDDESNSPPTEASVDEEPLGGIPSPIDEVETQETELNDELPAENEFNVSEEADQNNEVIGFPQTSGSSEENVSTRNVSKFLEGLITANCDAPSEANIIDNSVKIEPIQRVETTKTRESGVYSYESEDSTRSSSLEHRLSSATLKPISEDEGSTQPTGSTQNEEATGSITVDARLGVDSVACGASDLRTTAQTLDARGERLKRLEEQCRSLFNKVTATTIKSNVLSSKLELLHEQYGRSDEDDDRHPEVEKESSSTDCDTSTATDDEDKERQIS